MEPHWTLNILASGLTMGLWGGCYHHQKSKPLTDKQNLIQDVRISQDNKNTGMEEK